MPPAAWYFCDNQADADELGDLVRRGIKTATCSLLWLYEAENERVPEPGDRSIITDWEGRPLCIIETTEVTIRPYDKVDARFAYDEGEGDRSLAYWRTAHWRFFTRECADLGRTPAEDMPLVCERFRVVYLPPTP
ncbi:MAG: ASCH domain-containing protein [Anaerolineae bacterium]|nr:ASCH domain-containing protein [Anaerolineae bacterium]